MSQCHHLRLIKGKYKKRKEEKKKEKVLCFRNYPYPLCVCVRVGIEHLLSFLWRRKENGSAPWQKTYRRLPTSALGLDCGSVAPDLLSFLRNHILQFSLNFSYMLYISHLLLQSCARILHPSLCSARLTQVFSKRGSRILVELCPWKISGQE